MVDIQPKRLLADPLVHFLVLGAALFALYGAVSPQDAAQDSGEKNIQITVQDLQLMQDNWQKQYRRPPTSAETERMIAERIREEILYREALEMGLDQGDPAIRRQMAEKILFMFQDLAPDEAPTDEQLRAFLAANTDKYALPETISFRHVFFDTAMRDAADRDAANALAAVEGGDSSPRGDPFELGTEFTDVTEAKLARLLGKNFARELLGIKAERWAGPIQSDYGVHLVQVSDYQPARPAELAMVRAQVAADFVRNRREALAEQYYQEARASYSIDLAEPAPLQIASE